MDQVTLSVAEGRRYQERSLAKRRAALEADEADLAERQARDNPPAPPKAKPTCWVCGDEVQSGRNMGVAGLITGRTELVHAPTGQGAGCWTVMARARSTILPLCKVGPKLHDKPKGDILLRAEIDRLMTLPKFQAEVAGQWENSYHLSAKSPVAILEDKINQKFEELKRRQLGSREPDQGYRKATLDALRERATKDVREEEKARYSDPDIAFNETPARPENYEGEHTTENER